MQKQRVVFRADGDSQIGLGHVIRSLALAQMLQPEFEVIFAIQQPSAEVKKEIEQVCNVIELPAEANLSAEAAQLGVNLLLPADIVVLDGYNFDSSYQKIIKSLGCRLVCIDDLHAQHFFADLIINHGGTVNKSNYSAQPYTRFLLGLQYALLRPLFIKQIRQNRTINTVHTAFICMGGADTQNISLKVLEAICNIHEIKKIHVVIGSANRHAADLITFTEKTSKDITLHRNLDAEKMIKVMEDAQFAVCPASSVAIEILCVGLNLLTGYTAGNQKAFSNFLHLKQVGVSAGDFTILTSAELEKLILQNLNNNTWTNQKSLMGGNQNELFASEFRKLSAYE